MQWDLGLTGLGVLALMSIAFGAFTQLVFWGRATMWVGVAATIVSFVVGLVISEVWFGWATQAELQPNIDGLSFDEVLIGFAIGIVLVLVARFMTRKTGEHRPTTTQTR
jgi:Na+/proline symporter